VKSVVIVRAKLEVKSKRKLRNGVSMNRASDVVASLTQGEPNSIAEILRSCIVVRLGLTGLRVIKGLIEAALIEYGQAVRDEDMKVILRYRLDCKESSVGDALAAAQAAAAEKLIAEIRMLKVE